MPFRLSCGSSPHTRGTLSVSMRSPVVLRIIPAYAGNTSRPARVLAGPADHPRIRGEHPFTRRTPDPVIGSSPHTRGTRRPLLRARRVQRIIPAYAGNTSSPRTPAFTIQDHPRIRGEHVIGFPAADRNPGSSPHTRGTPGVLVRREEGPRIIPAYAGNTGLRGSEDPF